MKYFTVLVKTHYSRLFLDEQQKNILVELKKTPELKEVKARVLTINNIETDLEIAIWPLNGQMINQELKNNILSMIKLILGDQFILSIEINY
jgi:predicted transposase YdaD